jgi:uncharacterized protein
MAEGVLLEEWPDKNIGKYTSFYKNGNVFERGQFKSGGPEGVWEYFDENGKFTETKTF